MILFCILLPILQHVAYFVSLLTHFMVQDIIWKADCHSACKKISLFLYGTPVFQTPATVPYSEPAKFSSTHRSISP